MGKLQIGSYGLSDTTLEEVQITTIFCHQVLKAKVFF